METKTCCLCGRAKPLAEFNRHSGRPDGRQTACRECQKAVSSRYHRDNSGSISRRKAAQYAANPEISKSRASTWRKSNLDRDNATRRQRYADNPEFVLHRNRQRRAMRTGRAVESFTPANLRTSWEELDLYGCFFCGTSLTSAMHEEHFYPLSPRREWRGPHALWNLVPSCPPCNLSKSDREPWAFLRASLAERGTDLDACLAMFDEDGRLIRPTRSVDDEPPPGVIRLTS